MRPRGGWSGSYIDKKSSSERERKREVGGSGGTGERWWREDDMGKGNDG
jgi:hypothetical protein